MVDLAQGIAFAHLLGPFAGRTPRQDSRSRVEAWQQKNLLLNGQEVFSSKEGKVPRRVAPLPIQDSSPNGRPSGRAIGRPMARAVRPVPRGSVRLGAGPKRLSKNTRQARIYRRHPVSVKSRPLPCAAPSPHKTGPMATGMDTSTPSHTAAFKAGLDRAPTKARSARRTEKSLGAPGEAGFSGSIRSHAPRP